MGRRLGWLAGTTAGVVALVVGVAACSDSGTTDETAGLGVDADGSDDATSATTEPGAPEDLAMQAYRNSNEYMEEALAGRPPDPEDPELREHFSGAALNDSAGLLLAARQANEYYETTFESHPEVVTSSSSEVVFSDCVTETATTFDLISGAETGSGSMDLNWHVRVVATEDGWRVDELIPQEEPCTP